jgi:cytochrome P450 family 142 subfamily A polypeptide 1
MQRGDHPVRAEIDLLAGEFYAEEPHRWWRWMRDEAPVYWDERNEVWGITKYDDVMAIARAPKTFSNAQGIRPDSGYIPMMISMDAPDHIRRRKLVSPGFTPRAVETKRPWLREVCDALVDEICERGECDFVWDFACWLPLIVIGDMLGMPAEERATLLRWSDDLMRGLTTTDEAAAAAAATAASEWEVFIQGAIAQRRAEPSDDLLSLLVHAEIDGERLDDHSLSMEALLILIGGDETTRHVITGGMYELMRDPAQRQLLIDDPSRIPTAVEEMLRWVTPIKNMARTVLHDVEVRGQQLREGDKLMLFYPSANRDDDVFDDPDRFDVGRDPNPHIAFGGHGPHYCLGHNLARLELTVAVETLLERLPDMAYAGDGEPPVRPANFVSGYEAMPVTFTATPRRT